MNADPSARHVVPASDWDDFVAVCYFGRDGDWLDRCIRRAYLDMNRTLRGIVGKLGEGYLEWKTAMLRVLKDRLTILLGGHAWTQPSFDA